MDMQNKNENENILDQNSNLNLDESPSPKESFKDFIWETIKLVIVVVIIVVPIKQFLIQPFYVKGASMEPNFYDHEYLIIDEISYRFNEPMRGDIIVFAYPEGEKSFYIKRIIALPGERVVIKNGQVIIYNQSSPDGFVLDETEYLADDLKTFGQVDLTLTADQYYVLGDNRASSLDSRKIGPITRSSIVGKTWVRGWPLNSFKVFETPTY